MASAQAPNYIRWSTLMQESTFFHFVGKQDDNPKIQIALKELKKNTGTQITMKLDFLTVRSEPPAASRQQPLGPCASRPPPVCRRDVFSRAHPRLSCDAAGTLERLPLLLLLDGPGPRQGSNGEPAAEGVDGVDARPGLRSRGQGEEEEEEVRGRRMARWPEAGRRRAQRRAPHRPPRSHRSHSGGHAPSAPSSKDAGKASSRSLCMAHCVHCAVSMGV